MPTNRPSRSPRSSREADDQNPSSSEAQSFAANAFHLSEGKRLYSWFNCSGCHANGGGGMGPALIDDKWIYGSAIESIHATIRDGRPNGMPTFGGKVPDDQIWELAAYVRSMAGLASSAACAWAQRRHDGASGRESTAGCRVRGQVAVRPPRRRPRAVALLPLMLAGCSGWQSALDPKGPAADELARLIWFFTLFCAVIWLLVMIVLGCGDAAAQAGTRRATARWILAADRDARRIVSLAVGVTVVVLVGLTLLSFLANRTLAGIATQAAVTIHVTGHQWWWEVRYEDARADRILTSANEIHVPAGEPMRLVLSSTDVIHSFWVPNLAGKLDLIPGHENVLSFAAAEPGIYRGQCAEFCGAQHAHMAHRGRGRAAAGVRCVARPATPARGRAGARRADGGARGLSRPWLHDVPPDSRHGGGRHGRSRPHASGQPLDARRRDAGDEPRQPGGLDRRSARHQARRAHAGGRA